MHKFFNKSNNYLTRRLKNYVVISNKPVKDLQEQLKQAKNDLKFGQTDMSQVFQAENIGSLNGKKRSLDANGSGDQPKRIKLQETMENGGKPENGGKVPATYKEACKTSPKKRVSLETVQKSPPKKVALKKVCAREMKEEMRRKMESRVRLDAEEEKWVEEETNWRCEQYGAVVRRLKKYFLKK